jgi:hypothetical protein
VEPLDRDNARMREDAAAMRTATRRQRLDITAQRAHLRAMRNVNDALRERLRRRAERPDGTGVRRPSRRAGFPMDPER